MVRIDFDESKCKSPRECSKCLQFCPAGVFMTYPMSARKPGKKAEDWVVKPVLARLCTGCLVCEQACPDGAIKITVGQETAVVEAMGRSLPKTIQRGMAGALLWAGQKLYVP